MRRRRVLAATMIVVAACSAAIWRVWWQLCEALDPVAYGWTRKRGPRW